MDLQVLQTRETLVAGRTVVRLLVGVRADMNQHFVPVTPKISQFYFTLKIPAYLNENYRHYLHTESSDLGLPGVKAPPITCTPLPLATIPRILFGLDMKVVDVVDQVLQRGEELMALKRRDEVDIVTQI